MARHRSIPPEAALEEPNLDPRLFEEDEMTDEEMKQAQVGTLFALQGPQFQDVAWSITRYRTRAEMALDPNGKPEEWVADTSGELKGSDMASMLGGGTFHFLGYVPKPGGGVKIGYNRVISIAGPRKNFAFDPTAVVAPVPGPTPPGPPVPSSTDRLIRLLIKQQMAGEVRFERLLEAVAQRAPEAKPTGLGELVSAVEGVMRLTGAHARPGPDPLELAGKMIDTFHQGVTVGREQEPLPPGETRDPSWMPVLEKGLEVWQQMLRDAQMRRATAAGAPPPRPPSEARVVDPAVTPTAPPPPPTEPQLAPEWTTAIKSLYRSQLSGREPRDFADTLEDILDPGAIDMLKSASAEQVLSAPELVPEFAKYPPLTTEAGKVYLGEVLAGLREAGEPPDADETPG